jgi:hypothetical protein
MQLAVCPNDCAIRHPAKECRVQQGADDPFRQPAIHAEKPGRLLGREPQSWQLDELCRQTLGEDGSFAWTVHDSRETLHDRQQTVRHVWGARFFHGNTIIGPALSAPGPARRGRTSHRNPATRTVRRLRWADINV